MSNMTNKVSAALLKTAIFNASLLQSNTPGVDYYRATLMQRLPGGQGSVFEKSFLRASSDDLDEQFDALENRILNGDWEPYEAPNLLPGAIALRMNAPRCGRLGVVPISDLENEVLRVNDYKGTGKLDITVDDASTSGLLGPVQDHITAILCEENGGWVLATIHPGDPIPPSTVTAESSGLKDGEYITVNQAREKGFQYAKLKA